MSFLSSKDLYESLERVAREDGRSLSSTIEIALTNYLKEREAFRGVEKERRQYPRKALSVPTVITQLESGQTGRGAITEISLCGVRLLIPKDFEHHLLINSRGSRFEIIFNLPTEDRRIWLSCESNRAVDAEDSIQIGASFVDADFTCYKALQTYLMP